MRTYRSAKPVRHTFHVNCLRLKDGSVLWDRKTTEKTPPIVHPSNTSPSQMPGRTRADNQKRFEYLSPKSLTIEKPASQRPAAELSDSFHQHSSSR